MSSVRQNIFVGFSSEETPESSYKEKRIHVLYVKEFFTTRIFESTQKRHTGVREYMCFECEKTFTSATCLKIPERRKNLRSGLLTD